MFTRGAVFRDRDGNILVFESWSDHYLTFRGEAGDFIYWAGSTEALTLVCLADGVEVNELQPA